jgi:hypothetical protein
LQKVSLSGGRILMNALKVRLVPASRMFNLAGLPALPELSC